MHMPPNTGGGDFEPPPAGNHRAVCYRVIDLGTQQTEYQGQTKYQRKIMLSWELCDEIMPARGDFGPKPFSMSQRYTFSSHEKAVLRQHLESWRGVPFQDSDFGPGGFDIRNVLGKSCLLNVVHEIKNGKITQQIEDVAYQIRTPEFWNACTAVCDESDYRLGGSFFDGKGQPGQVSAVSHGSSTARFNGINVINTARSLG